MFYVVVYDQAAVPLRRLPAKDRVEADYLAAYFTDDLWKAVVYGN